MRGRCRRAALPRLSVASGRFLVRVSEGARRADRPMAGQSFVDRTMRPCRDRPVTRDRGERPAPLSSRRGVCSRLRLASAEADSRTVTAQEVLERARGEVVRTQLESMPLGRIREITQGRLVLGPIEDAGLDSVAAAADAGVARLQRLPRVGRQTAARVVAAAGQLEASLRDATRVRFNPDTRPPSQGELLAALSAVEVANDNVGRIRNELEAADSTLARLAAEAAPTTNRIRFFFARGRRRHAALRALAELDQHLADPGTETLSAHVRAAQTAFVSQPPPLEELWIDYERRAVAYNGLLVEIGGLSPDDELVRGHIPREIAERVNAHPLDASSLRLSLRGYQAFGAKFALAQEKSMLGDEMGLGKTIEALAVICHLASEGATRFLVICPASVLVNWMHEIERHSDLQAYRIHGADRETNLKDWLRRGGVGVTTYGTLRALDGPDRIKVALVVVDEAHYAKNPDALRSQLVSEWSAGTPRALFLTGTPMENRVEEFRNLVEHLQPRLAAEISNASGLLGASAFERLSLPSICAATRTTSSMNSHRVLRHRNGSLSDAATATRIAKLWRPATSWRCDAPPTRLGQSMDRRSWNASLRSPRRLRRTAAKSWCSRTSAMYSTSSPVPSGDLVIGQITGSVPPPERQQLLDRFTASAAPAALVSQIEARRSRPEHASRLRGHPHRTAVEANDRGSGDRALPSDGPGSTR